MKQASSFELVARFASEPLIGSSPRLSRGTLDSNGFRCRELLRLLRVRNGFYAFESALHVLPAGEQAGVMDLEQWNSPDLWRSDYGDSVAGCLFFAEDIFGVQFCIKEGAIFTFDPETAMLSPLGPTVAAWLQRLLNERDLLTGFPLAHAYQVAHGVLKPGERLLPKTPFVLGGAFQVENLYAAEAVNGMKFRAHLAKQIQSLPDGAKVNLRVTE